MNWIVLFYVIYLGVPAALLLFFGIYRPKLVPLTLLICPLVIFFACYRDFLYDPSQRLPLLLTMAAHTFLVAIPVILIWRRSRKR